MSYYETVPGMGRHGFTEGMGASFPGASDRTRTPNEGLRAIQRNLQAMGLLAPGTGATGADGLWGLRTAAALGQARTRLARTAPAFSTTNAGRLITIPDDFIAAIQAAANTATAITTTPTLDTPPAPGPDPSTLLIAPSAPPPLPPVVEETSNTRLYLIGGAVAVVAIGAAAYMLWPRKTTPNRRRRTRRRRR